MLFRSLRRKNFLDTLEVQIELIDESMLENYSMLSELRNTIRNQLKTVLGLDTNVTLVNPNTIERFQGKAKRVVDLRNEG